VSTANSSKISLFSCIVKWDNIYHAIIIREKNRNDSMIKSLYKEEFCNHENAVTLDYDFGIEHCPFCGALGHYNGDIDQIEWTLPEYLQKQEPN
jgi:hypothetical protein